MLASILVVVISWSVVRYAVSTPPVPLRCNPAQHICEGKCPNVPRGVQVPRPEVPEGICLQDLDTGACVCWMHNPSKDQHLQTLFRCDVIANHTVKHMMCLLPTICFPPSAEPGCMIVLHCPCAWNPRESTHGKWRHVLATIHRSNIVVEPIPDSAPERPPSSDNVSPTSIPGDSREFSIKHLLFLLAFVIAPLVCWCLLTFFHEGKCRKKIRSSQSAPVSSPAACEEAIEEPPQLGSLLLPPAHQPQSPTAPKFESPPPYREAVDPAESCLLAADCGPPPSYEDAVRNQWHVSIHRDQEPDSD